ncbi:MAG: NAD(P)H-dependent oxidoreductase subunit E [Eubacteriales bacterium]|nr:NAD(P)H-dependent oxidoreductase subunit E [Eubacteriales bacterium]
MGKLKVQVCAGTYCTMMGSMDIVAAIESLVDLKESIGFTCDIDLQVVPCTEQLCQKGAMAPVVRINEEIFLSAETETIMSRLLELAKNCQGESGAGASEK